MIKKTLSCCIKSFVFLAILLLIFSFIQKKLIFTADDPGEVGRFPGFYMMKENTLDYLVLGVSNSYYSVNPMQIYMESGYRGYNIGAACASMETTLYWLQEAIRYQSPQAVFFDVRSLLYPEEDWKLDGGRSYVYMKPTATKLRAVTTDHFSLKDSVEFLIPLFRLHANWEKLTADLTSVDECTLLKGYYPSFDVNNYVYSEQDTLNETYPVEYKYGVQEQVIPTVNEENKQLFSDMLRLCDENNIQLVPIKCPTRNWDEKREEAVEQYLTSEKLTCLDLNYIDDIDINWERDTHDSGFHTNYWGASKVSHFLSVYMENVLKLSLADEVDARWEKDRKMYEEYEMKHSLNNWEQNDTFFKTLIQNKDELVIIMAVRGEISLAWDQCLSTHMSALGLRPVFEKNIQNSYAAIIDSGTVRLDRWVKAPLSVTDSFDDDRGQSHLLHIESAGYKYGDRVSVFVQGTEQVSGDKGLNIAVFRKKDGLALSSAVLNVWDHTFSETVYDLAWIDLKENLVPEIEGRYKITTGGDTPLFLAVDKKKKCLVLEEESQGTVFQIDSLKGNMVTIIDETNGEVLTDPNYGNRETVIPVFGKRTDTMNQKWLIYAYGDGDFKIKNCFCGLMLDVPYGKYEVGTSLQLFADHQGKEQMLRVIPVDDQ